MRRGLKLLTQHVPTRAYELFDRTAPFYFPPVSYTYGAAHTLGIQYLVPLFKGASRGSQATEPCAGVVIGQQGQVLDQVREDRESKFASHAPLVVLQDGPGQLPLLAVAATSEDA